MSISSATTEEKIRLYRRSLTKSFSLLFLQKYLNLTGLNLYRSDSACLTGIQRSLTFIFLLKELVYEFRKPHPFQVSLSPGFTSMRIPLLRRRWLAWDLVYHHNAFVCLWNRKTLYFHPRQKMSTQWNGRCDLPGLSKQNWSPGFIERNNGLSTDYSESTDTEFICR